VTAYLTLLLGLLLPWLAGFVWLGTLQRVFNSHARWHLATRLGYGFFIGYAILFGCLHLADQLSTLAYWPIIIALFAVTITGALATKLLGSTELVGSKAPAAPFNESHHWLFWLLLGLTCVHLLLNTWEVFYRPVYAWDAWTTWIYRAKVWFFSADIYQLASPQAWLADPESATHAIPAYRYPTFPSVIPLWAVISVGQWSDTLVNTPVIGCGIALALALYGACRDEGLSSTLAMAAAYALISLPIIGAHLSLAGYADIWMAGFSGLGFIALLRGLIHSSFLNTVVGIALLAMGICLKYEGLAWLLIGLGVTAATLIANKRSLRLAMVIAAAVVLTAIALGVTSLELPLVGLVGIKDSFLYVPGLGRYQLVTYNVLPIYAESFFARSSWHLLWPLTVLTLIGLAFIRNKRMSGALFLFYVLFAASQMLIFGATEKGKFAELNTAVNRLIIHFLPALIFAVALTAHQLLNQWRSKLQTSSDIRDNHLFNPVFVIAPLVSIALVITSVWIATSLSTAPSTRDGSTPPPWISFQPQNFAPMMGGGKIEAGILVINRFEGGMAIASVAPLEIDTKHYPALSYHLDIEGSSTAMFFWRNADMPEEIHMTLIDPPGDSTLFLTDNPQWGKRVTEIGIITYGVPGDVYRLSEISLRSWGSAQQLEIITDDWLTYEPITQKFINWIDGGRKVQLVHVTSVLALALIVTLLIIYSLSLTQRSGKRLASPRSVGIGILIIWCLSDAIWLKHRVLQSIDTQRVYASGQDPMRNERANEGFPFQRVAATVRPLIGMQEEILVLPQSERMWFEAARLKLALAPIEAYAHISGVNAVPARWYNPILVIKDPRQGQEDIIDQVSARAGIRFSSNYEDTHILLLKSHAPGKLN